MRHILRNTFALALAGALALAPQASLAGAAPQRNDNRNTNNRNQQNDRDRDDRDRDGFDRDGRDRDDRDRDGRDRDGYDRRGFDRDGYDHDGYDRRGYDRDGCDRRGFDRRGRPCTHHGGGNGSGNGNGHDDKVTICHVVPHHGSQTLEVSEHAVAAHLNHGDYLGPCAASGYR